MIFRLKVFVHQLLRSLRRLAWLPTLVRCPREKVAAGGDDAAGDPPSPNGLPVAVPPSPNPAVPVLLFSHSSRLIKDFPGVERSLQENKVASLRKAVEKIDGLLIPPGKQFSFWFCLGRPSRRRGFPDGLELRAGQQVQAPGGGLCQVTNMLHWAVLNLGLEVLERHRHSWDLFPDDQRTIPFGTGATVFHNYRDFRFRNSSGVTLQVRLTIEAGRLVLRVFASEELPYTIMLHEEGHRFYRRDNQVHRANRIVQQRTERGSGETVTRVVLENDCLVRYPVDEAMLDV